MGGRRHARSCGHIWRSLACACGRSALATPVSLRNNAVMNKQLKLALVGVGVFALWWFLVVDVVWQSSGLVIVLGISVALNAALLAKLYLSPVRQPTDTTTTVAHR